MALAPATVQRIPDCLQLASTTPEPSHNLRAELVVAYPLAVALEIAQPQSVRLALRRVRAHPLSLHTYPQNQDPPPYPLGRMFAEWNAISESLADAPRFRLSQIATYFTPDDDSAETS